MTVSFARAGAWLLVQAAQFPDTVLMRQVGHIKWKQTLIYATTYSLGTLIVFQYLLKTQLPIGWIWPKL